MNKQIYYLLTILFVMYIPVKTLASGDMTKQEPIKIQVNLGNSKGSLVFEPNHLSFKTGTLYQLVIHNPSSEKHYFSSETLSRSVFTRKVQVLNKNAETIAEIKGTIREIEVLPGGTAEWWFVPVKTAVTNDLKCTIKGHASKGMTGTIKIN